MSNERSPRADCSTTTGISGMVGLLSRYAQPYGCVSRAMVAYAQPIRCRRPAVPVIERDVVLPVTRERAWELITEPAELEEWLADDVEFEASEGAPLRVTFED